MNFEIKEVESLKTWTSMNRQINLIADDFDKGSFTFEDQAFGNIEITYANFSPKTDDKKNPLIIWLHGLGEGGVDPNLVLLGNKVTNLVSDEIQGYFDGAYVLTPQTPTFWLNQGDGNMTEDGTSMYSNALMALIDDYVTKNEDIDMDRIYIGGCSNGGFMTMRMIIDNPTYFAAAFPICEALYDETVSDTDIQKIKHMPIWFTHAQSDELAEMAYVTLPTYQRLMEAGAENVHFTVYENVVDVTGQYFQEDGVTPFEYNPHFSWIYTLNNHPTLDFDGNPVMLNDKPVTIFEWLSQQVKLESQYQEPGFLSKYASIFVSFGLVAIITAAVYMLGRKKSDAQ